MPFVGMSRAARQLENSTCNQINLLTPSGSWTAFVFGCISAVLLIFSACAMNATHAWQLGISEGEFRAAVLAGASIGAAIMAPLAFLAVHRGRGFGIRATALSLGIGALLYTSASSLGFVSTAKDHGVSDRIGVSDRYADRRAVAAAARIELATLKGQTKAVIDRRRELAKLLVAGSGDAESAAPVKADAQAAALAFYFRAAGWQVEDAAVSTWLSLFMVLFLEAGAALSLTVAAALRPAPRQPVGVPAAPCSPAEAPARRNVETVTATQEDGRSNDDDEQPPAPPPRKGRVGRPRDVLPAQAIERIRAAGGRINGSVAGIGKLIGSRSKTSALRLLTELREAGLIDMQSTARSTTVALAG